MRVSEYDHGVCMQAREEVAELQKQLAHYTRDKASLAVRHTLCVLCAGSKLHPPPQSCKARLRAQGAELKSLYWEHEVLLQRFTQVTMATNTTSSHSVSGGRSTLMAANGRLPLPLPSRRRCRRNVTTCTAGLLRPFMRCSRSVASRISCLRES